ncbi:hypothetical protein ACFLRO_00550 [Bacteroidota bacterium]
MARTVRKPRKGGSIDGLNARLWRLFLLAETDAHNAADANDGEAFRKALHACSAISAQYRSSHETNEQEERLKSLERLAQTNPALRKVV